MRYFMHHQDENDLALGSRCKYVHLKTRRPPQIMVIKFCTFVNSIFGFSRCLLACLVTGSIKSNKCKQEMNQNCGTFSSKLLACHIIAKH